MTVKELITWLETFKGSARIKILSQEESSWIGSLVLFEIDNIEYEPNGHTVYIEIEK